MSKDQSGEAFAKKVEIMRNGFCEDFPSSTTEVYLGGRAFTLPEVVARLQQIGETLEAVKRAQTEYRHRVSERNAAMKEFRAFYEDAALCVRHHFGRESQRLGKYGVATPKPRRALSSSAKAVAKARAAATRALRGTKGRRQREAITLEGQPVVQVFGADGKPLPGPEPIAEPDPRASGLE